MHDLRVVRIEKVLASSVRALRAATRESESLSDLQLSNDLNAVLLDLERILNELVLRGRKYRSLRVHR